MFKVHKLELILNYSLGFKFRISVRLAAAPEDSRLRVGGPQDRPGPHTGRIPSSTPEPLLAVAAAGPRLRVSRTCQRLGIGDSQWIIPSQLSQAAESVTASTGRAAVTNGHSHTRLCGLFRCRRGRALHLKLCVLFARWLNLRVAAQAYPSVALVTAPGAWPRALPP